MKSCIKMLAGVLAMVALACGLVSCSPDVKYVDKTYVDPVTFVAEDLGENGVKVTMATQTKGATIYYTIDDTIPTKESTVYAKPVTFTTDATLTAIAVKDGIENSPVSVARVSIATVSITKKVMVFSSVILETGTYSVYHYQQKTNGGKTVADYVLENTEAGKTVQKDATLDDLKKTYEGFTAKSLAQNGTAIYIFYDRNTITYTFNTGTEGTFDDGTTSKTVSGLFGASYTKPQRPTSASNYFSKWQASDETIAPSTFGSTDMTFTATWVIKGSVFIPDGFVKVEGDTITGNETWTPDSQVFVSNRAITIPTLWVSDHQVTRGEFKDVMGTDPSTASAYDKDGNLLTGDAVLNNPVNYINWYDAIAYCNKLSVSEGLTPAYIVEGITDWSAFAYSDIPSSSNATWNAATCDFEADAYRLPTEAEWEYLARGGESYTYAGSNTLDDVAWYTSNTSDTGSREVKTKSANGYGLYDMSGNVWEWCWDRYGTVESYTPESGAASDSSRVQRGGSWYGSDGN